MNNIILNIGKVFLLCFLLIGYTSCELEEDNNPNGPSLASIEANATLGDLQLLAVGTESLMRTDLSFYYEAVAIIGREAYRITGSDPRYTTDLLGGGSSVLDNNTFYTTRSFSSRYRSIRNANILLNAVANTSEPLSTEEKNGFMGFAKTIIAYQLLLNLNMQYENGVRVDVADVNNLGPFLSYTESLAHIRAELDEANDLLLNAGSEFAFNLSSGFTDFNTPETFLQFNRGIAARVALYQEDWAAAKELIEASFYDPAGDMNTGVSHVFSTAGGDALNTMSYVPAGPDAFVAHPSFVENMEENDRRADKIALREVEDEDGEITINTAVQDGLSSDYDVALYFSSSAPIVIIDNEELILMSAEAKIQTGDLPGGLEDINVVRMANDLLPYSGDESAEALINEVLHQRRYSLFLRGHRWIDMRRYDLLNNEEYMPLDRLDDDVWVQFPRPQTEGE